MNKLRILKLSSVFAIIFLILASSVGVKPVIANTQDSSWDVAKQILAGKKVELTDSEIIRISQRDDVRDDLVSVVLENKESINLQAFSREMNSEISVDTIDSEVSLGNGRFVVMKVPDDSSLSDFLMELNDREDVLIAEPSYKRELFAWTPDDPKYVDNTQWQLLADSASNQSINMPDAWAYVDQQLDSLLGAGDHYGGNSEVIVAVLDTGLAYEDRTNSDSWDFDETPELATNLWSNSGEIGSGKETNNIDDDGNGYIDDAHGVNMDRYFTYQVDNGDGTYSCSGVGGNHSFNGEEGHPNDDHGHGTFVSNIIAGKTNNTSLGAGIAFNVQIMPIKVFDCEGLFWSSSIVQAIQYATQNGADVINMSFGGEGESDIELAALTAAVEAGVVPVAATGNSGITTVQYPAGYSNVLAVGASDKNGVRASYSNYGNWVDLVAPMGNSSQGYYQQDYACYLAGTGCVNYDSSQQDCYPFNPVSSAFTSFSFNQYAGTSFATPQVSAVAALVKSIHPDWSSEKIQYVVKRSARPISGATADSIGFGVLDASNAVRAIEESGNDLSDDTPGETFYFAEGYTASSGYEENLLIMNPDAATALVELQIITPAGVANQTHNFTVPAKSRYSIKIDDYVNGESSLKVRSTNDIKIIAERSMYGYNSSGQKVWGHDVVGSTETSKNWYFAEGYTKDSGYEEWLLIMNPGDSTSFVIVDFIRPPGLSTITQVHAVPANSRYSIKVDNIVNGESSIKLSVDSGPKVIAERAMYGYVGTQKEWGHIVPGATALADDWYFAEGYTTGSGYEQHLLMMNPSSGNVNVNVTYQKDGGVGNVARSYVIPPESRYSIKVDEVIDGRNSVKVEVIQGEPIMVERSMYGISGGLKEWGHATVGSTETSKNWYFAEGYTKDSGYEEWLLIMNPGDSTSFVIVDFIRPPGLSTITQVHAVPANSRYSIKVDNIVNGESSIKLSVDSGPKVIAERAMYGYVGTQKEWGHIAMGYAD